MDHLFLPSRHMRCAAKFGRQGANIATRHSQTRKAKEFATFVVDCTQQVNDEIFDMVGFTKYLTDRIKVNGKTGQLGDSVTIDNPTDGKVSVTARLPFSKRYLKVRSPLLPVRSCLCALACASIRRRRSRLLRLHTHTVPHQAVPQEPADPRLPSRCRWSVQGHVRAQIPRSPGRRPGGGELNYAVVRSQV